MEFTKEKPDCKFSVPDKPTVRQMLEYFSASAGVEQNKFLERAWEGAKTLIIRGSWKCEVLPEVDADLDTLTNPSAADVILWAGMRVREYMDELDRLPKN